MQSQRDMQKAMLFRLLYALAVDLELLLSSSLIEDVRQSVSGTAAAALEQEASVTSRYASSPVPAGRAMSRSPRCSGDGKDCAAQCRDSVKTLGSLANMAAVPSPARHRIAVMFPQHALVSRRQS